VVAALAMTCTHPGELARVGGGAAARPATDAGLPGDVNRGAAAGTWAGPCPVAVENAGVEVARVAGVGLTVCDVAVRAWQRTREGLPALGVRALVDELVAEEGAAALAREETGAGGLRDRAVAATLAEEPCPRGGFSLPKSVGRWRFRRGELSGGARQIRR
jgi:hypothetical protein